MTQILNHFNYDYEFSEYSTYGGNRTTLLIIRLNDLSQKEVHLRLKYQTTKNIGKRIMNVINKFEKLPLNQLYVEYLETRARYNVIPNRYNLRKDRNPKLSETRAKLLAKRDLYSLINFPYSDKKTQLPEQIKEQIKLNKLALEAEN